MLAKTLSGFIQEHQNCILDLPDKLGDDLVSMILNESSKPTKKPLYFLLNWVISGYEWNPIYGDPSVL